MRKLPGFLIAYLSQIISYAFNMELWVLYMLWLAFDGQDGVSRYIAHMILMNVLIGQSFKRFFLRKRPYQFQPPRAFLLRIGPTYERSSSFPSRVVLLGTTMVYLELSEFTEVGNWGIIGFTLLSFLMTSIARVHMGSNYPSDCLLSLPIALLVIVAYHG